MAVDSTLILQEVAAIIEDGEGISHYRLSCMVKAGERWLTPVKLDYLGIERDYEFGFGESTRLEVLFGQGDYTYLILPHREHLLVDLFIEPLHENRSVDEDTPTRHRRYRAILLNQDRPSLESLQPHSSNIEDLNHQGPIAVKFELVEEALYQTRFQSFGGNYRKSLAADILVSVLSETSRSLELKEEDGIRGVDLVGGFNQRVREQITIPHGTPLEDVPYVLQQQEGGIYSAGLGCFLQRGLWYIYPLYNPTRTREDPRTLTIIRVPPNRYYGAERTYRTTENQIIIIASGDVQSDEAALSQQLNEGNARRFTNAESLLTFGETVGNRTKLSRQSNVFEFEGDHLDSQLTHARWSQQRASANPLQHYSDLARKRGRFLAIDWLHGDIDLLYPGMPVKYYIAGDDSLQQYDGVLLGVKEDRVSDQPGPITQNFPASVMLKVFITRSDQEYREGGTE